MFVLFVILSLDFFFSIQSLDCLSPPPLFVTILLFADRTGGAFREEMTCSSR